MRRLPMAAIQRVGTTGMATDDGTSQYIAVTCDKCQARLHPVATDAGQRITCPDCGATIVVPSPALPRSPQGKTAKSAPRVAPTYRVSGYDQPGMKAGKSSGPVKPKYMLVLCPVCSARLHPRIEHAGRRVRCPDCETRFVVPPYQPAAERGAEPVAIEAYNVGAEVQRRHVERQFVQVQLSSEPVPLPDLPRWTFFSRVFTFPWRGGALRCWIMMSVGLWLCGLMLSVILPAVGVVGDHIPEPMLVVGAGFILLVFIWIAAMTWMFSSAAMMATIEETASGADRIESLPTLDWREWLFPALVLGFIFATTLAAGSGLDILLRSTVGAIPEAIAAAVFMLFPILLLSAMESDSVVAPLSLPVLRSLFTYWWTWGMFFVLAGLLGAAVVVPTYVLADVGLRGALIYAAPATAAAMLIYARLLGRLAWRITSVDVGQRRSQTTDQATREVKPSRTSHKTA